MSVWISVIGIIRYKTFNDAVFTTEITQDTAK